MKRTLFAAACAASILGGCTAYDLQNPAYYDDPSLARGDFGDPRLDDPFYNDPRAPRVYRDEFGRLVYPSPGGSAYYGRSYGDGRGDRDRHDRPKRRMTIEDAQYESVNGQRIDANRYVRKECDGENNCDVKANNRIFGDPDVGAHKDLIVRYRCGKGPSRTVRVPEKSEQDIKC